MKGGTKYSPSVSKRGMGTPPSPMRKFLPLIVDAEKRGIKVLKLNVGDPDLLPPPAFLQTIRRFKGPQVGYAPSPGFPKHVDAWLSYYKTLGIPLKRENLIPMVGCAEAILYALIAVTDPGDEVLVFEPFYPSYKSFGRMIGISLKPVTLSIDNNYALPSERAIERAIGRKTKAIAVINPNNPTGTVFNKNELSRIVKIAQKHNLFIISDETYRDIIFKGKPGSVVTLPGAKDRTIVVDSASKRFSLPGARIGCLLSYNRDVMAAVLRFCQARLSAGTLEQEGLIPLLKNHRGYVRKISAEYKKRHDTVIKELRKIKGVMVNPASGAFYLTVKLPVKDSDDFVAFLLKDFSFERKTVGIAPMTGFYWTKGLGKDAVRIAYVLEERKLRMAINLLARGLQAYHNRGER